MNENVLLISSHSFSGVESFDWSQHLPYLPDYHTIVLDTPSILTSWFPAKTFREWVGARMCSLDEVNEIHEKVQSNVSLVRKQLTEMLEFDVTIYALFAPGVSVNADGKLFLHSEEWCPVKIATKFEKGQTIAVKDHAYEEYFGNFRSWQYCFCPETLDVHDFQQAHQLRWKVTPWLRNVATNSIDKPIAIAFVPRFHKWTGILDWHSREFKQGGSLVLLPVIDMDNTAPLIEILLRQTKMFEKTPPPAWTSAIEIPGEGPLKMQIATLKQELEATQSKLKQLEDSLGELDKYKGLLYETGLTLQEIVRATLEQLGARTEASPVSDVVIDIGGKKALAEVKGVSKSISKRDLAQLIADKGEYLKSANEYAKGLLIGNAWRLLALEQRGTHQNPIFSPNVLRIAENNDIGLISTTELFKAFCRTLEQPQYKSEALDKVINGVGVITLE